MRAAGHALGPGLPVAIPVNPCTAADAGHARANHTCSPTAEPVPAAPGPPGPIAPVAGPPEPIAPVAGPPGPLVARPPGPPVAGPPGPAPIAPAADVYPYPSGPIYLEKDCLQATQLSKHP
jgi:hypothetical protein